MGKLNMEAIQAAKVRLERQGGSGLAFDKLANGKNVRRILWPKGNKDLCYSEGYIHFGLGDDGKTSMVCRKTNDSKAHCPVCEYISQLQMSKDKNDKKLAEAIKARKRVYLNVIDRDSDSDTDELKVLPVGLTIQKAIVAILCDPDYGDITDPVEGRDVTIKRTGQGLNTEYSVLPKPNASPASTTLTPEQIEEQMADLDAFWSIPSVEDMEKVIYGEDGDDDDYEPRNRSGAAKTATDNDDYDDMELDELVALCEKRGIRMPEKISKLKLITLLTQADEDGGSTGDDESATGVKSMIASALSRRGKR